jgi:transposase
MLLPYENRQVFIAAKPIDFRLSIDGLSRFIQRENNSHIHDGSLYVFYNGLKDKIKVLYWDGNGFVLYYKRLDKCKFHLKERVSSISEITPEELAILLAGFDPERSKMKYKPRMIEHQH